MNFQSLANLEELGYFPVLFGAEQTLYDSIKNSLKILGEASSEELVSYICSLYGLSEKELLTNYDLFEKSLYYIFGEVADVMLDIVKKEMLKQQMTKASKGPSLTVKDILKEIRNEEMFEFIHKIPGHEHIIFLYENENYKDKVLSIFFDTDVTGGNDNIPKGLLSEKPANMNSVNNILYDKFLQAPTDKALKKFSNWIAKLHSLNKSQSYNSATRIAGEDETWWLRNDFAYKFMLLEELLGKYIHDNIIIMCGYNISKLNKKQIKTIMKTIISFHGYVILDEPLMVYKAGGN
jgi:hypothetical protein